MPTRPAPKKNLRTRIAEAESRAMASRTDAEWTAAKHELKALLAVKARGGK